MSILIDKKITLPAKRIKVNILSVIVSYAQKLRLHFALKGLGMIVHPVLSLLFLNIFAEHPQKFIYVKNNLHIGNYTSLILKFGAIGHYTFLSHKTPLITRY